MKHGNSGEALGTVHRVIEILRLFGEKGELTLKEMSLALALAPSTCHRLLELLGREGFIEQDMVNRRYRIGREFFRVSGLVQSKHDVRRLARPFLERCLPTFTENLSGWGLDLLWPRMLPARPRVIAILDDVVMTHTRPVGGPGHDRLRAAGVTPQEESEALMAKHGIAGDVRALVYAGVDHEGRTIDASTPEGRASLRDMIEADHAAFARAVAQNVIVDGNARSTSAR